MRKLVKGVTKIRHIGEDLSWAIAGKGVLVYSHVNPAEGYVWKDTTGNTHEWWVDGGEGEYWEFVESPAKTTDKPQCNWTAKHYDHYYTLTPEDISEGKIRLDAYTVSKVWKIGSKDDSGALWHTFKLFPRWGEKNSVEREIKALYAQTKALAKIYNVKLED